MERAQVDLRVADAGLARVAALRTSTSPSAITLTPAPRRSSCRSAPGVAEAEHQYGHDQHQLAEHVASCPGASETSWRSGRAVSSLSLIAHGMPHFQCACLAMKPRKNTSAIEKQDQAQSQVAFFLFGRHGQSAAQPMTLVAVEAFELGRRLEGVEGRRRRVLPIPGLRRHPTGLAAAPSRPCRASWEHHEEEEVHLHQAEARTHRSTPPR